MQQEAVDVGMICYHSYLCASDESLTWELAAQEAMGKFTIEKDIAQHIKRTV